MRDLEATSWRVAAVVACAAALGVAAPRARRTPWPAVAATRSPDEPTVDAPGPVISWRPARSAFAALPALTFFAENGGSVETVALFGADGAIDEREASRLDHLLADRRRRGGDVRLRPLDRRLLSLVARAAHHFDARVVEVVSAYRAPLRYREGLHAEGRAMDFRLRDTSSRALAAFLRKQPRAGVGEYLHPRTRYVHLDVREQSFHWLDGTAPGRGSGTWRLPTLGLQAQDAAWSADDDLPERAP
ncbi:MAG: DUF882 domain-containing protein [Polyangiaceae bacterium]|nr:DUF882 domain-containing protein [Polyangiaceae bacterium]